MTGVKKWMRFPLNTGLMPDPGGTISAIGNGFVATGEGLLPYEQIRNRMVPGEGRHTLQTPRMGLLEQFSPRGGTVMLGDSLTENAEWTQMLPQARPVNRGLGKASLQDIFRAV